MGKKNILIKIKKEQRVGGKKGMKKMYVNRHRGNKRRNVEVEKLDNTTWIKIKEK